MIAKLFRIRSQKSRYGPLKERMRRVLGEKSWGVGMLTLSDLEYTKLYKIMTVRMLVWMEEGFTKPCS